MSLKEFALTVAESLKKKHRCGVKMNCKHLYSEKIGEALKMLASDLTIFHRHSPLLISARVKNYDLLLTHT